MPRLPIERVREGLLHPEREVRRTALRYFTESFWPDPAVMATVIEAVRRYGRKDAFDYGLDAADLAQSPESIRWAVEELRTAPRTAGEFYRSSVARTLVEADPDLLAPVADELFAAGLEPNAAARIRRRLALRSKAGDELWAELEALCAASATTAEGVTFPWEHGCDLVAALGRQGDRHVPRVMDVLPRAAAADDDAAFYMEVLVTRLAGELRHEPAVPLILTKFEANSDYLNEEAQRALSRIGTDAVATAALPAYRADACDNRIYLGSVLGSIRSDAGVAATLAAAAGEEEDWLKSAVVANLVQHLATEANDFARDYLKDGDDFEVLSVLVPACVLTGQDYPEMPAWRKALVRPRRPPVVPEPPPRVRHGPAPLTRDDTLVGRNDPCPCGSGKKYKKCCLPKAGAGPAAW